MPGPPPCAPDPGVDSFVANLLGPVCPAGALPPHPTRDFHTCALAPAVTPPDDAYFSPACVVCVMLGAGFRVFPIVPLPPRRTRPPCAIADRSRAQYQLCFGGHWVVTATGYTRHSRHFWAAELRAYAAHSNSLGLDLARDPGPRWRIWAVVDTRTTTTLLAAVRVQQQGKLTREGGIIVRAGDPDSPNYIDCNTARMTIGDPGHWLLRRHSNKEHLRDLVPDVVARPILVLLGYVPANPLWWRDEASRDHHLSWLYCDGNRTTVRHPSGRMYARQGALPDIYSGYLTRARFHCLMAQAAFWAPGFFASGAPPALAGELAGHPSKNPDAVPSVSPMATLDSGTIAATRAARTPTNSADFRYALADAPQSRSRRSRATSQGPPRGRERSRRPVNEPPRFFAPCAPDSDASDATPGAAPRRVNRHAFWDAGGMFCTEAATTAAGLAPPRAGAMAVDAMRGWTAV